MSISDAPYVKLSYNPSQPEKMSSNLGQYGGLTNLSKNLGQYGRLPESSNDPGQYGRLSELPKNPGQYGGLTELSNNPSQYGGLRKLSSNLGQDGKLTSDNTKMKIDEPNSSSVSSEYDSPTFGQKFPNGNSRSTIVKPKSSLQIIGHTDSRLTNVEPELSRRSLKSTDGAVYASAKNPAYALVHREQEDRISYSRNIYTIGMIALMEMMGLVAVLILVSLYVDNDEGSWLVFLYSGSLITGILGLVMILAYNRPIVDTVRGAIIYVYLGFALVAFLTEIANMIWRSVRFSNEDYIPSSASADLDDILQRIAILYIFMTVVFVLLSATAIYEISSAIQTIRDPESPIYFYETFGLVTYDYYFDRYVFGVLGILQFTLVVCAFFLMVAFNDNYEGFNLTFAYLVSGVAGIVGIGGAIGYFGEAQEPAFVLSYAILSGIALAVEVIMGIYRLMRYENNDQLKDFDGIYFATSIHNVLNRQAILFIVLCALLAILNFAALFTATNTYRANHQTNSKKKETVFTRPSSITNEKSSTTTNAPNVDFFADLFETVEKQ